MAIAGLFRAPGWKKAAAINAAAISVFSVFLLAVLIFGCVRAGGLNAAFIVYEGPCKRSNSINLGLHLFLNVLSTLILASSNFFMQIISAPSRTELDEAHKRSMWLDIGVPSLWNFLNLARPKPLLWLAFACSSIPLHLFFNSIVFEVGNVPSAFGLTMAAEPFVQGAEYFLPGASLWSTRVPFNCTLMPSLPEWEENNKLCYNKTTVGVWMGDTGTIDISEWLNKSSEANMNISRAATSATASWERLDPDICRRQFLYCGSGLGLTNYRNVVMVVNNGGDSNVNTAGWTRSEVFPGMSNSNAAFWDQVVPADEKNSLWLSKQCQMLSEFNNGLCHNDCKPNFGFDSLDDEDIYTVDPRTAPSDASWTFPFWGPRALQGGILSAQMRTGFSPQPFNTINVSYCLAERAEQQCKIGVSNSLLLAVVICVFAKAAQCLFVMIRFVARVDTHPLVTPGDAVDSLLRRPDPATSRMCTLQVHDLQTTWARYSDSAEKREVHGVEYLHSSGEQESFPPQVRQWRSQKTRYFWTVAMAAWARAYVVFLSVLGVALYYFSVATNGKFQISGTFGNSGMNKFVTQDASSASQKYVGDFIRVVLLANFPQFILSISYLQFNSLVTRMFVAKEWALMSTAYRPLRVTDPKGDQVSTYRLQLPYAWSIPIIIVGIVLHWLVSNTCYVFIADGGFYGSSYGSPTTRGNSIGLSDFGFVGFGYSTKGMLASIVVFAVIICVPLVLAFREVPGKMVVVGSNSLAIAAACHASTISKARSNGSENTEYDAASWSGESGHLIDEEAPLPKPVEGDGHGRVHDRGGIVLSRLAESKIKWGVVTMPPDFYKEFQEGIQASEIGHLSFGVEKDQVQRPIHAHWYA